MRYTVEAFIKYLHQQPGIEPQYTNHDLIDILVRAYNHKPKDKRAEFYRHYRRGIGVTTTIDYFLNWIDDPKVLYVSCFEIHRNQRHWSRVRGIKAPLIIFDNALSQEEKNSVVISERFLMVRTLLRCPFVEINQA